MTRLDTRRFAEVASTDFRIIDVEWSWERLRTELETSQAASIVVRRSADVERPLWYRFSRTAFDARLKDSDVFTAAEALNLDTVRAMGVVDANALRRACSRWTLVVDAIGPIGIIAPEMEWRSPTPGAVPAPADDATRARRELEAVFPLSVTSGATATLLLTLSSERHSSVVGATIREAVGTEITIVVTTGAGLTLVGPDCATFLVGEPGSNAALPFTVRAGEIGPGRLCVSAFASGRVIARLDVETTIVAREAPTETVAWQGTIETAPEPPPDLSIWILENGDGYSIRTASVTDRRAIRDFGTIRLAMPREYFETQFADIEIARGEPADIEAQLNATGSELTRHVIPGPLQDVLWALRDRIASLQVVSQEPWIPWELCRLLHTADDGRIEEGPFFAETFAITRWIEGAPAVGQLRLDRIGCIATQDNGLEGASAEAEWMHAFGAGRTTAVAASMRELRAALARSAFDAWHFCGHARASGTADANRAAIELQDGEQFRVEDIAGEVASFKRTQPLVFLNACQSARGGLSLTGLGGWAQRLLQPEYRGRGASAFIGTYWSVDDDAARDFAQAFYAGLDGGATIGDAMRQARDVVRRKHPGDASWLAYTCYADPNVRVTRADA